MSRRSVVIRRAISCFLVVVAFVNYARSASAHPAPFSYLDLNLKATGLTGSLVVHEYDAGFELNSYAAEPPGTPAASADFREDLIALLSTRVLLLFDGQPVRIEWGAMEPIPERQSLKLHFSIAGVWPARIQVRAHLFPYDSAHQTFLNIYEDDALRHQAILDVNKQTADYYSGSTQGRLAVIKTFVLSGIEHILIGPDHVLFLIGLLLLRGSLGRLAAIVTAFTIGHSITLSLAALDLVSPPSRIVEPLIALTIVVVGADNLLVLRGSAESRKGADIRAGLAAVFGLIHGFGFASVLKEFGLPKAALGWSLFAFNLGVEIGQLFIVVAVAGALTLLARRTALWASRIATGGSIAVILAGLYWFVERTFFPGAFS